MKSIDELFAKNKIWANAISHEDPTFFSRLAKQQEPKYLWIGCSDSRVPATQIVDLEPGEIFVHRNIANLVVHTDLNCLSVIQYAVDVLKVEHIMIVGHYDCGGVKASMSSEQNGLIDNWLGHIKDINRFHSEELSKCLPNKRMDRLCELNVLEQVRNLCNTTILKNAWKSRQNLTIHGWIYNVENGIIKSLSTQDSPN